jgi:hypothetical protein
MKHIRFIGLLLLAGCKEAPYNCKCDTSYLHENDSVFNSHLKENLQGLDKLFKQRRINRGKVESYRLYMEHSMNRNFQVFNIVVKGNKADLFVQQFERKGRHRFLDTSFLVNLSVKEWSTIKTSIAKNCFWSLQFKNGEKAGGLDGGILILEGYMPTKRNCANRDHYFLVDIVSKDKRMYEIANTILKFAKIEKLRVITPEHF